MFLVKSDVIVLGAGIVGVSAALHLQARGRDRSRSSIGWASRRARPASAIRASCRPRRSFPMRFPGRRATSRSRAQSRSARASPLLRVARDNVLPVALFPRLLAGKATRERPGHACDWSSRCDANIGRSPRRGVGALLREGGWIKVFRTERGRDAVLADAEEIKPYGRLRRRAEPGATARPRAAPGELVAGGVHFTAR